MITSLVVTLALSLSSLVPRAAAQSCVVNSVASAASLSSCTSVTIEAFTVPSGSTITIAAKSGATVTMTGDVTFAKTTATANLFTIDTDNVIFNGNGHTINGNGALYWDGLGTNGGVTKPHPFVKIKGFGTFKDFTVLNSPAQAISIGTSGGAAVIDTVTVDNSAGDAGALGHNTDGFDLSASSVTIQNSVVKNQDDCLAINSGSTIVFQNNQCSGGHGISIGSIATGKTVSGVTISGNTVTTSMYGIRIKVDADATSASVSGVTYSGNTLSGITKFGVLISQSYPDDDSTPGTGAPISGVAFTGTTTSVSVNSGAQRLTVDCGKCSGTWNFSKLSITGGSAGTQTLGGAVISPAGSY